MSANQNLIQTALSEQGAVLPLCYGYVRAVGNQVILYERGDKSRIALYILGEGEWDGIERLWINKVLRSTTDTTLIHFHPGQDGELGHGLAVESNGGDQRVDNFFSSLPANYVRTTFSRKAYIMVKVAPDPSAPSADLDLMAEYRTTKCRQFDNTGAQTSYAFSTNGADQILDVILRKMVKRYWTTAAAAAAGGDLTADEKARFDWVSYKDSKDWCDFALAGGQKRFSSSVAWPGTVSVKDAVDQLKMISQLYVIEAGGKIYIRADKPRASSFLLTAKHLASQDGFALDKSDVRGVADRIIGSFRDLNPKKLADLKTTINAGLVRNGNVVTADCLNEHGLQVKNNVQIVNADDASFNGVFAVTSVPSATTFKFAQSGANVTSGGGYAGTAESRFAARTRPQDHKQHQLAIGQRGLNLTRQQKKNVQMFDLGANTMEQVQRTLAFKVNRELGIDTTPYLAPWTATAKVFLDAVDPTGRAAIGLLQGDVITVDPSVSEEGAGDYELTEANSTLLGDGDDLSDSPEMMEMTLKTYLPAAFSDLSDAEQDITPNIVPTGLEPVSVVDVNGVQQVVGTHTGPSATARDVNRNMLGNPQATPGTGNLAAPAFPGSPETWYQIQDGAGPTDTPEFRNGGEIRLPKITGAGGTYVAAGQFKGFARFYDGANYSVQCLVRFNSGDAVPNGNFQGVLKAYSNAGVLLATIFTTFAAGSSITSTYQLFEMYFTFQLVAGANFYSIEFQNTSTNTDLYFEQPMLNRGTGLTQYTEETFLTDVNQSAFEGYAFVEDNFTDANGTLLSAHIPDLSGWDWIKDAGAGTGDVDIQSNKAQFEGTSANSVVRYVNRRASLAHSYSMEGDAVVAGATVNDQAGVIVRWRDTNNLYSAVLQGDGALVLRKKVAGVVTTLSTVAAVGTSGHIKLTVTDAGLRVDVDGVNKIISADTSLAFAAGEKAGINLGNALTTSHSTFDHPKAMYLQNVANPGTPPAGGGGGLDNDPGGRCVLADEPVRTAAGDQFAIELWQKWMLGEWTDDDNLKSLNFETGRFEFVKPLAIWSGGVKRVYTSRFDDGVQIRSSRQHKFFTAQDREAIVCVEELPDPGHPVLNEDLSIGAFASVESQHEEAVVIYFEIPGDRSLVVKGKVCHNLKKQ